MSNDLEQRIKDEINFLWDAGEYEEEFDMWCSENGIHKDDAPDYEDEFVTKKFVEIMNARGE